MSCARNVRAGAKIVSEDDVYLDARVVFLIECLRHPRKTRRFHTGAVENHPRALGGELAETLYAQRVDIHAVCCDGAAPA